MKASQHREIASAIIIDTGRRLLLQQRDDVFGILHAGQVGLFGGHREGDETYLECVVRETHEEISYFVPAERFGYLASLHGTVDKLEDGTFRGKLFVSRP
jgi:8-oxo-dGTP diphosphatase